MTVAELMAELAKLPADAEVWIPDDEGIGWNPVVRANLRARESYETRGPDVVKLEYW